MAWSPLLTHDIRHIWPKLKSISSNKPSSKCTAALPSSLNPFPCARPSKTSPYGKAWCTSSTLPATGPQPALMPGPRRLREGRSDGSSPCCTSRLSIARRLRSERRSWRSDDREENDDAGSLLVSDDAGLLLVSGRPCSHRLRGSDCRI